MRKKKANVTGIKTTYQTVADFLGRTPKWIQNFLALWIPLLLLLNLQPLSDWIRDKNLVSLPDLFLPLILYSVTSIIFATIFYWFFLRNRFLALALAIGTYFAVSQRVYLKMHSVWNFLRSSSFVSKIFNSLESSYLFIYAFLFIFILYFLFRLIDGLTRSHRWNLDVFYRGVVIAISVAFSIQLVGVLRVINTEIKSYRPARIVSNNPNSKPKNKPDIYYLVLDRYTNRNSLKEYFNYNNSDFTTFLTENGFSVNPDAYSNYPSTASSIASTLKADYHNDLSKKFQIATSEPYFNSIYYAPVIKALKKQGYSYYHIGSWYDATTKAPLADRYFMLGNQLTILGHNFTITNFPLKELKSTLFWRIALRGIKIGKFTVLSFNDASHYDWEKYKIEKLKEITDDSSGPKFVFAHILVPHNPYVFNTDGSASPYTEVSNRGKPIKQKYTDQVQYINGQMKELINTIKQKSENQAVIIIQADEGPYPSQFKISPEGTMEASEEPCREEAISKWTAEDIKLKWGILAAYYLPEVKSEDLSAGGNSVNIFRLVFNTYFNYGLPYLPNCHFTVSGKGEKGSYDFLEISDKLTGSKNPDCPDNGIFNN